MVKYRQEETQEPKQEVVPVPRDNGEQVVQQWHGTRDITGQDVSLRDCPTNLDPDNPPDRALLFAAGNPGDYHIPDNAPLVIVATHYLLMPDQAEDPETGEIKLMERLVLFDKDGKFYRTSSAFAWKRLKAAIDLFPPADWQRGIQFVICARLSQRKRVYHDIRVLVDAEDFVGPASTPSE